MATDNEQRSVQQMIREGKLRDIYYDEDLVESIKDQFKSKIVEQIEGDIGRKFADIRSFLASAESVSSRHGNYLNYKYEEDANEKKIEQFAEMARELLSAIENSQNIMSKATANSADILNAFETDVTSNLGNSYSYGCGSYGCGSSYIKDGFIGPPLPTDKISAKEKQSEIGGKIAAGVAVLAEKTKTIISNKGTSSIIDNPNAYTGSSNGNAYSPLVKPSIDNSDKDSQKEDNILEDELRKKEEELLHKERELSDRETALDTHEKHLQEKEKELNEREKELQEREEKLKDKEDSINPASNPNNQGDEQKPDSNPTKTEPVVEPNNEVPTPNEEQPPAQQVNPTPSEESPVTQMNNPQPNNSYQNNNSQGDNAASQNIVATPTNDVNNNSNVSETQTPSQKPIVDDSDIGNTTDLFGNDSEDNKGGAGVITDLPNTDNSSQSTKSSKGFNPVPLAVGLGAAVAGGVGVKAYKNHKENSQFDDTNEDSFTNGNRFWSEDDPSVINSEQNELSGEDLLKEQTTSPSYSAISNGNNDTWSIDENSQNSGDDNSTFDLLSNN